ncbi:DEAD/DEAH box helicase [Paenibacillus agri]|uniref:DEAD/DEAH box helicase n=1 Tax=Paenibacillus agri TaxID=2744309 RepID=A0A850EXV2_9BACL|nr:DEAD/DEAH box helicase [Paenibacillus agri]NUU62671.1 DEAD/DEAH box helicase [Paenibacillus agri]
MGVPQFLHALDNDPLMTFGTLEFDAKKNEWVMKGDQAAVMAAKRMFPGAKGRGKTVRWPRSKRTDGDLNWFMMRYPLEIKAKTQSIWENAVEKAREHTIKRLTVIKNPVQLQPEPSIFNGELRTFQQEGAGFLINSAPTLLADDMGLGKTVQALAWVAHLGRYPGIIIVPTSVQRQWEQQIKRFIQPIATEGSLLPEMNVHIIKGLKPYKLPQAHFYIIHYGLLRAWGRQLAEMELQFAVFDEAQELRHSGTEKYSNASILAQSIADGNVIALSGTPIYNTGSEMWNIMNILDFQCLGDFESFSKEWCAGYGEKIVKDPEALGSYLRREGLMLRRSKTEVLSELPSKHRVVQAIDSDDISSGSMGEIMDMIADYDAAQGFERGRLKTEIGRRLRQETGRAKAPYVAEFAKMLLDAGEAIILYGYHHGVYDIWRQKLKQYNPVFITGEETSSEKERSKEAFIRGKTNLIIISLRAAAGIDGLQHRANVTLFGELDWSPGIHSQCEDRVHRMGQEASVLIYYLVSSGGSDEQMLEALGLKTAQIKGIMGEQGETEDERMLDQTQIGEHLDQIIERLKR